jgi:aromatic-L-amino-acid decarboxylase
MRADSIVVNPHKWLFTPFDLSAFYCRRMNVVREAFSVVPDYLKTAEGNAGVRNLMDTGIQLGRRFRALKLWMILRHFGAERLRDILREHIRLAQQFAADVDDHPDFERLRPAPFATVCFRANPRGIALTAPELERFERTRARPGKCERRGVSLALPASMGRSRSAFRLGHLRTSGVHTARAWQLLVEHTSPRSPLPDNISVNFSLFTLFRSARACLRAFCLQRGRSGETEPLPCATCATTWTAGPGGTQC